MNHDEAKFLLRAHRPGTADDRDPVFAEALDLAARDPELRAWLESQRAFDDAVARKLEQIQPESGSLETILAAARAQRRSRRRARTFVWLAAAAALAVLLSVTATLHRRTIPSDGDSFHQIALADMNGTLWRHRASTGAMESLGSDLLAGDLRAKAGRLIELSALRADGCRVVSVAGREVFEFCFGPRHEYHLYVAKRDDFPADVVDGNLRISETGRYALASWADERHVYSLVSYAGVAALKQVL